jgi:hypothetical protein
LYLYLINGEGVTGSRTAGRVSAKGLNGLVTRHGPNSGGI